MQLVMCKPLVLFYILVMSLDEVVGKKMRTLVNYASDLRFCDENTKKNFEPAEGGVVRVMYNDTVTLLDGKMELKQDIDETYLMDMIFERKRPNGAIERVFLYDLVNICHELEVRNTGNGTIMSSFFRKIVDLPEKCPITARVYTVKDMNLEFKTFTNMVEGNFVFTIKVYQVGVKDEVPGVSDATGKDFSCFKVDIKVDVGIY